MKNEAITGKIFIIEMDYNFIKEIDIELCRQLQQWKCTAYRGTNKIMDNGDKKTSEKKPN